MPPTDRNAAADRGDRLAQHKHDLTGALTTISGRAQLLARRVQRSSTLADDERAQMLDGLAAVAAEVTAGMAILNAMSCDDRDEGGAEP
jgi:hypothetical protein